MLKYKEVFLILKLSSKIPLKQCTERKKKKKSFWFHGDGLKQFLTMNPMGKHKNNEQNFRKHDISY